MGYPLSPLGQPRPQASASGPPVWALQATGPAQGCLRLLAGRPSPPQLRQLYEGLRAASSSFSRAPRFLTFKPHHMSWPGAGAGGRSGPVGRLFSDNKFCAAFPAFLWLLSREPASLSVLQTPQVLGSEGQLVAESVVPKPRLSLPWVSQDAAQVSRLQGPFSKGGTYHADQETLL